MQARIAVDGKNADAEGESLWEWLRREPELRGRVRVNHLPAEEGTMGLPVELVVVLATTGFGAVSVLGRTLSTWLEQRRSDITITVTGPDGRQVTMSAKRIADPEALLRQALDPPDRDNGATA